MKPVVLVFIVAALCACSPVSVPPGTVTPQAAECLPTNQDAYVYSPDRLEMLSPCIRVSGIIKDVVTNPLDGDVGIGLVPDPPFQRYLTPPNELALGSTLHVEAICAVDSILMGARAKSNCSLNPNPLRGPLPVVGQHVWMEGRWVLDHSHGGWAELHPLYRWGQVQ